MSDHLDTNYFAANFGVAFDPEAKQDRVAALVATYLESDRGKSVSDEVRAKLISNVVKPTLPIAQVMMPSIMKTEDDVHTMRTVIEEHRSKLAPT